MEKRAIYTIVGLFLAQILLCVYGTQIFLARSNPFALILLSVGLTYTCYQALGRSSASVSNLGTGDRKTALFFALVGFGLMAATFNALQGIWEKYPDPGTISDVLPQLQGQADLFFAGQPPYQRITTVPHHPYPVYLPLHWLPFGLSTLTGMDSRWPGVLMMAVAVGISGYVLYRAHPNASLRVTLPAMGLFVLPLLAFIQWSKLDLGVSAEGIVTAWYLLLSVGLATRKLPLIVIGLVGGLLSRYTFLFWLPLFAMLLWWYESKQRSFWVWGIVAASGFLLFVLPFLVKDPTILESMKSHYNDCSERSWVRPDEYTFREGLSLNIHLREWLPGAPEQNSPYKHIPQFGLQLLLAGLGFWYYRRKAHLKMDIYTYSLVALSIMPMLFYTTSPMLFRYYMLMPLMVSAVLVWKTLAMGHPFNLGKKV
jgi:hypothetical protein